MTEKPMVSIIIPVYNGSNYLNKAIDSALAQTYDNLEIIVINDGSTDSGLTDTVARSYGDKIRYFQKENGGVSSALNLGLRMMKGDYFSWLSHDDEYFPEKIASQIDLLRAQKSKRMLALCGTNFIDESSVVLSKKWKTPDAGIYTGRQALDKIINRSLSGISLLIPKSAFQECGCFDESLRYTQDKNMWRRIFLSDYELIIDSNCYAKSRLHGAQQTNLHRERFYEEMERTEYPFCVQLLNKHYYELVIKEWLCLLKNNLSNVAMGIKPLLEKNNLLSMKLSVKGAVFYLYGKIRPIIRKLYYQFIYNIQIKR